jgi:hypothetical protein
MGKQRHSNIINIKTENMKKGIFAIIIGISTLLISCKKNNLDLEGNWIKLKQYDSSLDSEGLNIETDTINVNLGDEFSIKIFSQYQPECELMISKRVNDSSLNNITDFPEEAKLVGYYEENGIERKINEIKICLSEPTIKTGDKIEYTFEIKSSSEIKVERRLTLKIK